MMGMDPMDFESELEEANKAIEEYIGSLSPEEQAEFNKQVDEMSQMFENMNEDEFEKFLGEMFAEEPLATVPLSRGVSGGFGTLAAGRADSCPARRPR